MEENEKKKKSRGWVKDAAIIFLAVLLVLTFFSNTILNRSLPEVATVYVQEGTITNKVRVSGTVSARENYDVTIDQTRKVQSVQVRVGDEVTVGDVLFTLQPGDSDELEQAEKTLKDMERNLRQAENDYQIWLLSLTDSDAYELDEAISDAREALQDARDAQKEAEISDADRAEYEAELAELEGKIAQLEGKIDAQQAAVDAKQAAVDAFGDGVLREIELQRRQLQDEKDAKVLVVREKQAAVEEKQAVVEAKKAVVNEKQTAVDEATKKLNEAIETRNRYSAQDPSFAPVSSAWDTVKEATSANDAAKEDLDVQKLIYGSDYDIMVQEATFMEYDYQVYAIEKDTELRYRQDNNLKKDDELTEEQQAELDSLTEHEVIVTLGERSSYEPQSLNTYMAVAATMYPDAPMTKAYQIISRAQATADSAKEDLDRAQARYDEAYGNYYEQVAEDSTYYRYNREVQSAQTEVDKAKGPVEEAQKAVDEAQKAVEEAQKAVSEAQKAVDQVDQSLEDLRNRENRINNEELHDENEALTEEKTKLSQLEADKSEAEQKAEKLKSEMKERENTYKNATQTVRDRQRSLDKAIRNLENNQKSDSIQQIRDSFDRQKKLDDLEEQRLNIEEQEAKIEELSGSDGGTEVKANVSGKVQSLNVSAGHKAEAQQVLAVIEVPDLGYSMNNISVTNEQARRLKVGDSATVSNFYWGSQTVATLASIQTDPQNPQGSKLLNFDVTGDVTVGSTLTVSIGERNANYDMVVPNSAVRSDTNGSFVLMITAKNSPLGNRYFASRVNVEVIASDDQYSAISGAIEAYDSVITTASRNAPISSGDQVRLADSN